jgi:hypothetical protein
MGAAVNHITPHLAGMHVPAPLRALQSWLIWRYESIEGEKKPRKIPYYANGSRRFGVNGASQDRAQLTTFEAALQAAIRRGYSGVGVALLDGGNVTALDFDDCVTASGIAPEVEAAIAGTYAEYSPSGTGIRAFITGELGNRKSHGTREQPIGFETFSSRGFVTVTGNALDITELTACENVIAPPSTALMQLHGTRFARALSHDGYAAESEPIIGLSEDQINQCLAVLDPECGHDDWLHIGMALHHETLGDGFALWDAWSALSGKYPGREALEARWTSFGQSGGRPITARALVRQAASHGVDLGLDVARADDFEIIPEPATPTGGHFKIRSAADFMAQVRAVSWLIKGVLPHAQLGVLFGESGSGKSFLAFDMCAALSMGQDWNGHKVPRAIRVLYVVAEGVGGFNLRMQAYCHQYAIPPSELNINIISDVTPNLIDPASVKALVADIKAAGAYDLIVMDTFAQVTPGANENAGEDIGRALGHCKHIGKAAGGALVLLVHHSGKDASKGARGWSGLRAAADVELEVTRFDNNRCVEVTKLKDGRDGAQFGFKLLDVVLGADEDGDDITSCIVEYGDFAPPKAAAPDKKIGDVGSLVLNVLRDLYGLGADGVPQVELIEAASAQLVQGGGRDKRAYRVTKAIERLVSAQFLRIQDGCVIFADADCE